MSDQDDLSGREIGGFVLGERIGEGGFGAVYACKQVALGREAVIKVLHQRLRRSDVIVQRFMREAKLASQLDHPYAAHVYAFGIEEDDRLLWIAMERVHGVTLAQWLNTRGPMSLAQFVAFFELIAEVVQTAHDRGIVHRDLKPSNVMVIERAGKLLPKLLDFGVAKMLATAVPPEDAPDLKHTYAPLPAADLLSGDSPVGVARSPEKWTVTDVLLRGEAGLTLDNQTLGSPPYMSPELWSNPITVGPASDLYALGILAFEALTGQPPFKAATQADYVELHCRAKVPALGGNFSPVLDRMFQRALAKRPEDRWSTALELAGALRAASGVGASQPDLPRIDEGVRDAWLAEAPQPLAESVAALDGARNVDRARETAQDLVRNLLRYLVVLAIATRPRAGDDDPSLLELVRALNKRELAAQERLQLLRLLMRAHGDHPIPELADLVAPGPDGTDALEPILGLYSINDHSGSENSVRVRMQQLLPVLSQLLHKTAFLHDYLLVVPRGSAAERWTGRRQQHRVLAEVLEGELVEGHPMLLDRHGRICADLWPLVQAAAASDGAEPELFLFDGHGPHGAQLISAPRSIVRDDSTAWKWVTKHLIAEVEAKARMRDQVQTAAQQWEDGGRSNALLWRGNILADYLHWTRHTAAPPLPDREAAFIAASRRGAQRRRWGWGALLAVAVATAFGVVVYRAHMQAQIADEHAALAHQQAQTAQQIADASVTTAQVEQGRAALLHNEFAEAKNRLGEAYRRGERSPGVQFMLARALQPRLAELARFTSFKGRMWSAAYSPDGKQIVATDETCARVWDTRTNQLLFMLPHGAEVYQAAFSVDGAKIVTVVADVVRIWDAATGALVRELRQARSDGKPRDYYLVTVSSDGKLVAATDSHGMAAHVWDASTGVPLAELRSNADRSPSLAFSADSRWLAMSGGSDVRVFDTRTWKLAITLATTHVRSLSFDPTGPRLATGGTTGDASIWEVPSGARLHHLREVGEPIGSVAFSPDGELVAVGAEIWNASSGALQSRLMSLHGKIQSVEFDPTSMFVVVAGDNGSVVVADALQGMQVTALDGPQGGVRSAHFDPSSRRVIGASWDGTARVWDAVSPYRSWSSLPISDSCGLIMSLEPDRQFIAVGCRDHTTRVWDTASDRLVAELPPVTQVEGDFAPTYPAISAGGDRAAIARGKVVEVYELPGGRLLRTIAHGAPVSSVAFATAGHDLVSGGVDGSLLITRDGHEPFALPASPSGIDAARILADGRVLAAAGKRLGIYDPDRRIALATLEAPTRIGLLRPSGDGRRLLTVPSYTGDTAPAVLWDLEGYRVIARLEGNDGQVFSARFVAADSAIITTGNDGAVRLWSGVTGQPRQTYRASSRFLADATLSPDGALVVGGSNDGLVWFWDVATGRPLWTLQAHQSPVVGVHFEGSDIVTRGFGGDVSRWALPKAERVIEACNARAACAIVPR